MSNVLVVDDSPDNLALLEGLLHDHYQIMLANDGEQALALAASDMRPDLILLDILMPSIDGYEVCRRLKGNPLIQHIPVVFLTARSDDADEQRGLDLGAVDYITKPIRGAVLLARVRTQLTLKAAAYFLRDKTVFLEEEVARRTREVMAIQDVTTLAMASLAETRDADTGNHIRRTQRYVKVLAWKLSTHPRFAAVLTPQAIQTLRPGRGRCLSRGAGELPCNCHRVFRFRCRYAKESAVPRDRQGLILTSPPKFWRHTAKYART